MCLLARLPILLQMSCLYAGFAMAFTLQNWLLHSNTLMPRALQPNKEAVCAMQLLAPDSSLNFESSL